jgi:hypothetical protein
MKRTRQIDEHVRRRRASVLVGWGLLLGGATFFIGGSMHPKQDPPDVTVHEHLRIMFEDPAWYPSHAVLLVGMVLLAASLVGLVRHGALAAHPRAQKAGVVAAVTSVIAAFGMALHLVAGSEAGRIAAGESTPIVNVHVVVETLTVPAFGFSIAAFAVIAAFGRIVGDRVTSVIGLLAGVGYGLAGGTLLFIDSLNGLFPLAAGIGIWAAAAGIGLIVRSRASRPAEQRHVGASREALAR